MKYDVVSTAAVAALAILFAPVQTLAEDVQDEAPFDQIVVVANKDERSIREVAANVTVMSREDLNAELATAMGDVFRYVPGIDYEAAGTRFGTEGINIRGIGGNRCCAWRCLYVGALSPGYFWRAEE